MNEVKKRQKLDNSQIPRVIISLMRRILLLLFFFSGFSALVYEVVWQRQLSLIFGVTSYATATILAIFFTGLALGSFLIGRFADKNENLLKIYGLLEIGLGLYAVLTPFIFDLIRQIQINLASIIPYSSSSFNLLAFVLVALGLILPTILMGGTLPVLSKFFGGVSYLYFLNTLGGVIGALMAGFILIVLIGVRETIWLAALINILIGTIVLIFNFKFKIFNEFLIINDQKAKQHKDPEREDSSLSSNIILFVFFLAGFGSLSLEVLWTRVLILFMGASVYAFALVLVAFLAGIALGSLVFAKFSSQLSRLSWFWFAGAFVFLGAYTIFSLPLFTKIPFWLLETIKNSQGSFNQVINSELMIIFFLLFIPTFLMGLLWPWGVQKYTGKLVAISGLVGRFYAVNTFGGVMGSLLAGFVIIPIIGIQKGIWLAGSIYVLSGILVVWAERKTISKRLLICCFTFLIILIGYFLPSWNKHYLVSGPYTNWRFFINDSAAQAQQRMEASELLYYKEGKEAIIAVKKLGKETFLRIDGKTDASTGLDIDTQVLSGALPMLLHPNPEEVLVVGLGSGITLGSVEQFPAKKIEVVEIEPAIIEANKYFNEVNYKALEDQRLNVVVGDGRNYLLTLRQAQDKQYDVITSEPSNVWLSGNSKLFTQEYFQIAKKRLKKGGVFAHWIQLYSLSPQDLKIAIQTFKSVFPYTTVWDNLSSYDLLLVGSEEPINLEASYLERRMNREKVKNDLARIFIDNPEQFLSYLALDDDGVEKFTQGALINSDNHPYLEFNAPKTLYQATTSQNIESLKDLRPKLGEKYADFRQHVVLGKMYYTRGENDKAISEYEEAYKIDTENGWLNKTLGDYYLAFGQAEAQKGNGQGTENYFTKAVKLMPDNPLAHYYLAVIYKIQGKIENAKKELETVLKLNPQTQEAKKLLEEINTQ